MFGSFHIEIAFFSSLGNIIAGSRGTYIPLESSAVAMGPMKKFLRGKVRNRCYRGHTLLSVAIHGLHLERFFEHNVIHENFSNELENWENGDPESDCFKHLFEKYATYMEEIILHRDMKINDTQLFAYVLYQISSLFFSKNRQKYALCMTLYSLELMKLPEENLILIEMLHNGRFSVKISGSSFSHVGVDMALE